MDQQLPRGLGESDQVHPARHVALGDGLGAKLLRAQQRWDPLEGVCAQLGNVAAQKAYEVFHIGRALGQWRILAQHQRDRFRRGRQVITLRRLRLGDGRS